MSESIAAWLSEHECSLQQSWVKLSGKSLQTVQESLIHFLIKNIDSVSIVTAVDDLLSGFASSKDESTVVFKFRLASHLLNKLLIFQTETSIPLVDKIIEKFIEILCNEDCYTPIIQKLACEYIIHYAVQFKDISWLSSESIGLYNKIKASILSLLEPSGHSTQNIIHFTFESSVYLSVEILTNNKYDDNDIRAHLFTLALNRITTGEHNERRLIVTELLPLLLDPSNPSHLQKLWESIQTLYAMQDLYRKDSYDILCRFIDKYLNQDTNSVDLRCLTSFWSMVQEGFLNGDGIIMKRSSFLLKKCILVTSNNKIMESPTRYFQWDSKNNTKLRKCWDIFFLIFETLEEFNLHLIQPIWSQFKILDKEGLIDDTWINILYQRAFANDNPTVRKWTIITVLDSVDEIHYNKEFVLGPLYNGLIDNQLYKGLLAPRVIEAITKFMYVFTLSIKDKDSQILWIQQLISKIEQTPVIPSVAITTLLSFIIRLNHLPIINSTTIASLCSLIVAKTYLFHGSWKVKFYTLVTNILSMHSNYQNLQFEDIVKYLRCLNSIGIDASTEQFLHSEIWLYLKKWLSQFNRNWYYDHLTRYVNSYYQEPAVNEVITSYELKRFIQDSKLIIFTLVLSDSIDKCVSLLRPLFEILSQVYARSYICEGYPEKLLSLLTSLLQAKSNSEYLTILKEDINSVFDNIVSYIELKTSNSFKVLHKFKRDDATWYYQCHIIYMSWLDSAFSSLYLDYSEKLGSLYAVLLNSSLGYLLTVLPKQEINEDTEYMKVAAMNSLYILSKWISVRIGTDSLGIILNKLLDITNIRSNKPELCTYQLDPIQKDVWKYCGISLYDYKWNYLYNIITYATKNQMFLIEYNIIETMVDIVTEELDVATIEYMSTIADTLRLLMIPYLSKLDTLNSEVVSKIARTFEVGWSSVLEKKSIAIVSSLISLIYQPVVLKKIITNSEGVALIKNYFNLILEKGQSMPVIVNILSFHLCQFVKLEQSPSFAIDVFRDELVSLCIFGPDRPGTKKQEDFDSEIIIPSYSNITDFANIAIPVSDLFVRVNIINLLQFTFPNETCSKALSNLLLELLSKQLTIAPKKQYRYFSEEHKSHIRLWQIICTFVPHMSNMDKTLIQSINTTYWDTVMLQNHKSVRYFIEIFGSAWLHAFPIFIDSLINSLSDLNARADIIQSALIMGLYLLVSTDFSIPQTQPIMKSILMWLTTHHLHIRKTAQTILVKLVDTLKSRNSPLLQQEPSLLVFYEFIHNNPESAKCLAQQSILLQLISNPVKEFSLELILYQLFQEEGFPQGETINTKELGQFIGLKEANLITQTNEPTENTDSNTSTPTENKAMSNEDFQKKIRPWATLEYEETMYREDLLTSKSRQNIMVCASLIDRVPNMAGLSRTCEIFNAKALILPNKKIVDHPQFQEISVTAEKWLPIVEVTEADLQQYLLEKKQEGWTIVGLEQTANSKTLVNYNFPEKTLLLLGKEKEGIPVEYLQLVDQCIEIPQLGLIRSLNVHVAGSLFIWEYTKQQLLKQN